MFNEDINKELEEAIENGPTFGQSRFQTHSFVIAKQEFNGRTYRQLLLELNNKYTALKKCKVAVKRLKTQMLILENKLQTEKNPNERSLIECDLEDKDIDLRQQEKLVIDAIADCNYLYSEFKKIPHITPEEFEKEEKQYWEKRLILDAELSVMATGRVDIGTAMSLVNIGHNPLQIQTEIAFAQYNNIKQIEENKQLSIEEQE